MLPNWPLPRRAHRSIAVLSATLIGAVTTIMLLCAATLFLMFGGDDDGTWGAADVANALKTAITRNEEGRLVVQRTARLDQIIRTFPTFWYIVSDKTGEVDFGPIPKWRARTVFHDGTSFVAYAVEGETRHVKRMTAVKSTPVGDISIETGGVAYTAAQLTIGTLTDATYVALPVLLVLAATAFTALVFVPTLIARPVRAVAKAAEMIDGVPDGRRLPETSAPAELLPLVSAFNRALARIDAAAQAQRNFLANAAHELRTPLTNARTSLEQVNDPALRAELIAENQKLSSIVTMLLQLARIAMEPAGHVNIDLAALGRKVTAEHVPMALDNGTELEFAEPGHPIWVQGSEPAIAVALSNLIRNAVLHAGAGGPIVIRVEPPASLNVIDSGPGLQLKQRDLLLQPYQRGSTRTEGVGLGLSIVMQVMVAHNGSVCARETPGGGATIELKFPSDGCHPQVPVGAPTAIAELPLQFPKGAPS